VINVAKIRDELGLLPETVYQEGLLERTCWYLQSRSLWENILSGEYKNNDAVLN